MYTMRATDNSRIVAAGDNREREDWLRRAHPTLSNNLIIIRFMVIERADVLWSLKVDAYIVDVLSGRRFRCIE